MLKLNIINGKINPMNTDNNSENLDSNKLIDEALKNNDINSETAIALKETYADQPSKLHNVLSELSDMRIKSLMDTSWSDLDKSNMGEELNNKYALGHRWKKFLAFGKNGKVNMDTLIEWAITNGIYTPDLDNELFRRNLSNDPEKLKEAIREKLDYNYNQIKNESWKDWEKSGNLEKIKKDYFQVYKNGYKQRFGIPYVEKEN